MITISFSVRLKLVTLGICLMPYASYTQSIRYNFSSKNEGYHGKVKKITYYVSNLDFIDSIKIDSILDKKGKVRNINFFNEKGLLIRSDNYNDIGNHRVKFYKYDDYDNVISIITERFSSETASEEVFEYNYDKLMIIQKMDEPQNVPIGNQIKQIFKKRLKFNKLYQQLETEYIDEFDNVVMNSRYYYDDNSNLILFERLQDSKLKDKYIQTFDLYGRKKVNQSIDENGNFTEKTVFNWIDKNTRMLEIFDSEQNLEAKSKEVYIKDVFGNIIKKYFYDLINNTSTILEYEIEYY